MTMLNRTILSRAEIEERFADEWVLMEITAWDEARHPSEGIVIAHSPDQYDLVEPTREFHRRNPEAKMFTFYTGPLIPEGMVLIL